MDGSNRETQPRNTPLGSLASRVQDDTEHVARPRAMAGGSTSAENLCVAGASP